MVRRICASLWPPPPLPAAPRKRRRRRSAAGGDRGDAAGAGPAPRPSRNMAPSASTRPAWTQRRARRRFLPSTPTVPGRRTRRSRPTSRTTACSPSSTICREQRTATIIEDQAKDDPNSRIGDGLRELHGRGGDRGEGPGADRAVARPGPRRSSRGGLAGALCRGRRARHRHPRSAVRRPGRRKASDRICAERSPRPASACPTATIILSNDPKLAETRAEISRASDQHADSRRRAERGRARQGDHGFRDRDRQGATGPAPKAATRPRPTTR